MPLPPSFAWKLVLALVLIGGIALSAFARAPRRPLPPAELRHLVLGALSLYGVGVLASVTHHPVLAGIVYAAGISACALAAWLSRGDSEDPPRGEEPPDHEPPPDPDGLPEFDWRAFETQFRSYSKKTRELAGSR
jgi:hypothetical protein